jgi:hypothetical protein
MAPYLPNTNITSLSIGSNIYCYVQSYHGALIELGGQIATTKRHANVYSRDNQTVIGLTVRYREDDDEDEEDVVSYAPKMFTPLAAASLGKTRVFVLSWNHFRWLIYGST